MQLTTFLLILLSLSLVWKALTTGFFADTQRRRDRINEKMRALQELIPNCNKVSLCFSSLLLVKVSCAAWDMVKILPNIKYTL